jgi:hypothetical protein
MPDIYDDPDIKTASDFPDQVRFERVGDKVRGRVLTVEKINTRFGPTLKYTLLNDKGDTISMLAGSVNLKGQMLELKPRMGDVIDVELIELRATANGTAKIYDIQIERGDAAQLAPEPRPEQHPSRSSVDDEGDDLFNR